MLSKATWLCTVIAVLGVHASAHALVDASCSGTVEQSWSPGLKLFTQSVDYTNDASYDCTTSVQGISGGGIAVSATYDNSCLANIAPTGAFVITWSDSSQSTLELEGAGVNVIGTAQVFTAVGTVTAGRFAGDEAVLVNTFLVTELAQCLSSSGLTELDGSSTLLLTSL